MKKLTILLLLGAVSHVVYAQNQDWAFERFTFDTDIPYDSSIPSPNTFLGYELGAEYTFHHKVMDYLKTLSEASDKITIHAYGKTHENRELNYIVITSKNNQERIEEIKAANLARANNPEDNVAEEVPIVVWMSYNVHGNEPSSSEAAMQTAYRLVAATDQVTSNWLENAVIVIDPMLNPDGRDRYVYWYKSSKANVLNVNADDLEHDEIWPGGRTNHYWFDLNRDWTWLVHPESQGRIAAYQQWMPQVHIDFHEQGFNNNYFTMPGTTPRNHELPEAYETWADVFGRGAIEQFDAAQVNYETRERFDFFYPGYGSSYPSIMGGIGMLAEQGGHSRGGRAVQTNDGYVLTLRQRVFDHYKNGVSIVKTSVENREKLLAYFKNARSQSSQKGNTKAYILPDNPNDYTYHVVNLMRKHGVRVDRAETDFTVRQAYSYWDGNAGNRRFKAGDFIIQTNQPAHLFINTLFRRQLEIKDSVMYDMSTWSVPLAYNLDAAWSTDNVSVNTVAVQEEIKPPFGVENTNATYAYVIDWAQMNAPEALAQLWEKGYNVRSARKTFTKSGTTLSRGSLVVLLGRNTHKSGTIHKDMADVAAKAQVRVAGFNTGRMDEGSDLGSPAMSPVKKPDVALMIDAPFSSYTAGQLWFLFDQWTQFGVNRIRTDALGSLNLKEYEVILMPGASRLSSTLNDAQRARLKAWVREGGTLIGTESSAAWLTKNQSGMTDIELFEEKVEDKNGEVEASAYTRFEDRSDSSGLRRIPGTAFKAMIDNSHPLAFGMPDKLYSLKFSTNALYPTTEYQVVGYYHPDADEVVASGYASVQNKHKAAGKAFAGVYSLGRGNVVFLLDNTQYRMFWVGPSRMVQNAVMLLPGF
ncbi:MAG: M14 family metallopeptidase [Bacteroidota bacterium]